MRVGDRVVVTGTGDGITFNNEPGTVVGGDYCNGMISIQFATWNDGHEGPFKTGSCHNCWNVSIKMCRPDKATVVLELIKEIQRKE